MPVSSNRSNCRLSSVLYWGTTRYGHLVTGRSPEYSVISMSRPLCDVKRVSFRVSKTVVSYVHNRWMTPSRTVAGIWARFMLTSNSIKEKTLGDVDPLLRQVLIGILVYPVMVPSTCRNDIRSSDLRAHPPNDLHYRSCSISIWWQYSKVQRITVIHPCKSLVRNWQESYTHFICSRRPYISFHFISFRSWNEI